MTDFVTTGLFHDLRKKRSSVMVQWTNDSEKTLDDVKAEAANARATLEKELEDSRILDE